MKINRLDVELENRLNKLAGRIYTFIMKVQKKIISLSIPIEGDKEKVKLIKLEISELGTG